MIAAVRSVPPAGWSIEELLDSIPGLPWGGHNPEGVDRGREFVEIVQSAFCELNEADLDYLAHYVMESAASCPPVTLIASLAMLGQEQKIQLLELVSEDSVHTWSLCEKYELDSLDKAEWLMDCEQLVGVSVNEAKANELIEDNSMRALALWLGSFYESAASAASVGTGSTVGSAFPGTMAAVAAARSGRPLADAEPSRLRSLVCALTSPWHLRHITVIVAVVLVAMWLAAALLVVLLLATEFS